MAEIAHGYAEQLTAQTHTGDLTYNTKLTVSGASFVGSAKYLLIVMAQVGGDNTVGRFKFQTQLDGVTPTGAEHIQEPSGSGSTLLHPYIFGTVWTTPASPGDVTFQIAPEQNTDDTARADTIQIFYIRIDADLTENTDWHWNEDTTNTAHATVSTWDDRASVTFTPGTTSQDWLVLAFGEVEVNSTGKNFRYRINYDSDTDIAPMFSQEGEDTAEQICWMLTRVFTLTAAEHTFTVQSNDDSAAGAENNHNRSGVIAINLHKFETRVWDWTEAPYTLAATDTFEEIADLAVTPATAGNWVVLGTAIHDADAINRASIRCQLAGTTVPTGKDGNWDNGAADITDELQIPLLSYLPSLAASSQDIDIDARVVDLSETIEDRSFCAFSLELASAGNAFSIVGASTITATVAASALLFNLNASIAGASSIDLAIAAGLNYTFIRAIAGASTITAAIAAAMDYTLNASVTGASTITPTVAATLVFNLNASVAGDVTITPAVAATMLFAGSAIITGDVTIDLAIAASVLKYSLNASTAGDSAITLAILAAMSKGRTLAGDSTITPSIAATMVFAEAGGITRRVQLFEPVRTARGFHLRR